MPRRLPKIATQFREYFNAHLRNCEPKNRYQEATKGLTSRASDIERSLELLLNQELGTEMAILGRSAMNLHWIFRYIVGAQRVNGKWQFEDEELPDQLSRSEKFLAWHWIDFARRNPGNQNVYDKANLEVVKWGYPKLEEMPPRFQWYHGPEIKSIWDLARKVGGEKEYETYSFASGLEHTDSSSILFGQISEPILEDTILADAIFIFQLCLDSTLTIWKMPGDEGFKVLTKEMDAEIARVRHIVTENMKNSN